MSSLDLVAAEVRRLAEEAFQEVVRRIRDGQDARDAISAVQAGFNGQYVEMLRQSFSELLQTAVSSGQVREMPIGEVSLSRRLYANAREVSSAAREIIRQHTQAMADARKLALELYEGYGFKEGGDPLQVKAKLPKYLREAVRDAEFGPTYETLLRRIQTTQIKTEALKVSYLQVLDAAVEGAGSRRLERALRVAHYERNRYFANRIAQTELHRADTDRRGAEIMADDELEVVQIVLSSTHPRADICDLHAGVDKFGLGPGCYPKARAPKPPFHPFCRCLLRKRYDLTARLARERDAAERQWLEQRDDAHRIVGSRQKAADVLGGSPLVEVINEGRDPLYHLATLGSIDALPFADEESNGSVGAYSRAISSGRHGGFARVLASMGPTQLHKTIASLRATANDHIAKIASPEEYVSNWRERDPRYKSGLLKKWQTEVDVAREQISIVEDYLREQER